MITFANDVASFADDGPLATGLPSYEKWAATQRNPSRNAWARVILVKLSDAYQQLPASKQEQLKQALTVNFSYGDKMRRVARKLCWWLDRGKR